MTSPIPTRFYRRGLSKVKFAPAVSNKDAPTRAEISAGVDFSNYVSGVTGFSITNAPITTPDLGSSFDSQIDGSDSAEESGFTLYDDKVDDAVRTALAKGTNGYVLLMPYGDVPTNRCEVWPVRSTGFNDDWSSALEAAAATASVRFAITAPPHQDAVIPAAT
jgi:hypothetical protein